MNAEKKRIGYLEGWVSAILNTGLFALKLWAGIASGSVAMIADAWHTLSDTLTSAVVLVGFWIAGKPRDGQHPFGHGRAEVVSATVIGTLLGLVGLNFLRASYLHLDHSQHAQFGVGAIVVFACAAVIKEGLAQFALRLGNKVESKALVADGWHHRSDAIASAVIVVGALFGERFWWVDGVLGVMVSFLIMYAAYGVLRGAWGSLMGEAADKNLEEAIRKAIGSVSPEVSGMHHIHVHRYGDHTEVTLHVGLPGDLSLRESHNTATRLEAVLRERLDVEPTVHFEPASGRVGGA